jgi:hypothetical protein
VRNRTAGRRSLNFFERIPDRIDLEGIRLARDPQEYIRRNFFEPIGMTTATFWAVVRIGGDSGDEARLWL